MGRFNIPFRMQTGMTPSLINSRMVGDVCKSDIYIDNEYVSLK